MDNREAGESYRDYINELELPHSQLEPLIYCERVMLCMEQFEQGKPTGS